MVDKRHFVDTFHIFGGKDRFHFNVTEKGYLFSDFLGEKVFRTTEQNIRLNADFTECLDTVLGGLRFYFSCRLDVGYPGEMYEDGILFSHFIPKLPYRFEKRKAFDISHGAADFHNCHITAGRGISDIVFDLIGNMWNDLNSATEVLPFSLLGYDGEIDLSRGEIV